MTIIAAKFFTSALVALFAARFAMSISPLFAVDVTATISASVSGFSAGFAEVVVSDPAPVPPPIALSSGFGFAGGFDEFPVRLQVQMPRSPNK